MSAKRYKSEKLNDLKAQLKDLAKRIRFTKKAVKQYQREHGGCHGAMVYVLIKLQNEFRCKHIAYCLIRGKEIKQIEQPREHNEPNMSRINKLVEEYTENTDAENNTEQIRQVA